MSSSNKRTTKARYQSPPMGAWSLGFRPVEEQLVKKKTRKSFVQSSDSSNSSASNSASPDFSTQSSGPWVVTGFGFPHEQEDSPSPAFRSRKQQTQKKKSARVSTADKSTRRRSSLPVSAKERKKSSSLRFSCQSTANFPGPSGPSCYHSSMCAPALEHLCHEKSCSYAHTLEELRPRDFDYWYKTEGCRNWAQSETCAWELDCRFIHDETRLQVGPYEFWLIMPQKDAIQVELVDPVDAERLRLLKNICLNGPCVNKRDLAFLQRRASVCVTADGTYTNVQEARSWHQAALHAQSHTSEVVRIEHDLYTQHQELEFKAFTDPTPQQLAASLVGDNPASIYLRALRELQIPPQLHHQQQQQQHVVMAAPPSELQYEVQYEQRPEMMQQPYPPMAPMQQQFLPPAEYEMPAQQQHQQQQLVSAPVWLFVADPNAQIPYYNGDAGGVEVDEEGLMQMYMQQQHTQQQADLYMAQMQMYQQQDPNPLAVTAMPFATEHQGMQHGGAHLPANAPLLPLPSPPLTLAPK